MPPMPYTFLRILIFSPPPKILLKMSYREELLRLKIYGKQVAEKKIYRIPKVSPKRKLQIVEDKALLEQDKIFYKEIWDASPHVCGECGCSLGKEPLTIFFHHLFPKSVYPQFRHTPENIIILCSTCHSGVELNLSRFPAVLRRKEEVGRVLLPK